MQEEMARFEELVLELDLTNVRILKYRSTDTEVSRYTFPPDAETVISIVYNTYASN